MFKDFDFPATILVRGGRENGNGGGSTPDGSGIWRGQPVLTIMIAGATVFGDT